jgi:hypothetical protein
LRVLGIFVQKGGPDEGVARLWQGIMKELILQNKGVNEQFWSVFGVIFLKQLRRERRRENSTRTGMCFPRKDFAPSAKDWRWNFFCHPTSQC